MPSQPPSLGCQAAARKKWAPPTHRPDNRKRGRAGRRQLVSCQIRSYCGYRRPIANYQRSREHVRGMTVTTNTTRRVVFGGTKTVTRITSVTSRSSFSSRRR